MTSIVESTDKHNNTQFELCYTKPLRNCPVYSMTNFECSICYKLIQKKMFVCSKPCKKVFHPGCLEKHFQQTLDSAAEEDNYNPIYKCCYCRRKTNINVYFMEMFVDSMISLQNSRCYFTQDVIDDMRHRIKYNPDEEYNDDYEIYQLHNIQFYKKPKQSKRAEIGNKLKKQNKMPRVAVKQRMNRNR